MPLQILKNLNVYLIKNISFCIQLSENIKIYYFEGEDQQKSLA